MTTTPTTPESQIHTTDAPTDLVDKLVAADAAWNNKTGDHETLDRGYLEYLAAVAHGHYSTELEQQQEAVDKHFEVPLFGSCGHEHTDTDPEALDIGEDDLVCEDGYLESICGNCCIRDDTQTEECREHHAGGCWPCPNADTEARADTLARELAKARAEVKRLRAEVARIEAARDSMSRALIDMERKRDAWKESCGVDRRDLDTTPEQARAGLEKLRFRADSAEATNTCYRNREESMRELFPSDPGEDWDALHDAVAAVVWLHAEAVWQRDAARFIVGEALARFTKALAAVDDFEAEDDEGCDPDPGHLIRELRTVLSEPAADTMPDSEPRYARIHVRPNIHTDAWPVVERVPGGWQSGQHHYPDSDVLQVIPIPTHTTEKES